MQNGKYSYLKFKIRNSELLTSVNSNTINQQQNSDKFKFDLNANTPYEGNYNTQKNLNSIFLLFY